MESPSDTQSISPSKVGSDSDDASSTLNQRFESTRDWWFLKNSDEESQTWQIMLKTRQKLEEYSSSFFPGFYASLI
jgi:hypothetical protein